MSEVPVGPPIHTEGAAPGEELHNYTTKKASDDGKYVVITNHSERIEMLPQPLTPEEIEAQKKAERTAAFVGVGAIGLMLGFFGWIVWMDEKVNKDRQLGTSEPETTTP